MLEQLPSTSAGEDLRKYVDDKLNIDKIIVNVLTL